MSTAVIKGLGITKEQLKAYIQGKLETGRNQPLVTQELYSRDDGNYSLVTENLPRMVVHKIRMRVILAALEPTRTKPLIQVWLEAYNEEMISYKRQGRQEYLGALQALGNMDAETVVSSR